jgi:outer membrane protein assembly factor BamB
VCPSHAAERFRAARLDGGWINSRKTLYAVLIGLLVVGGLARAVMAQVPTLTAAGITDGFTLTTFATTNPGSTGCCAGPFGVAVASSGNIFVGTGSGSRYVFADTDGQTVGSALFTQTNSSFTQASPRPAAKPMEVMVKGIS